MAQEKPYVSSTDIGMLKGEINGVTIEVTTEFTDGVHTLSFYLNERKRAVGESEIAIQSHSHPYGDQLRTSTCEPEAYADDIHTARETAFEELERRRLDDPVDWHSTEI